MEPIDVPGIITAFDVSLAAGIGAVVAFVVNLFRSANVASVFDKTGALVASVIVAGLAVFAVELRDGFQFNDVILAVGAAVTALSSSGSRVQGPNAS